MYFHRSATAAEIRSAPSTPSARSPHGGSRHSGPTRATRTKEARREASNKRWHRTQLERQAEALRQALPGKATAADLASSIVALRTMTQDKFHREWSEEKAALVVMAGRSRWRRISQSAGGG